MMCGDEESAGEAFKKALKLPACGEYVCEECYEAYYGLGICCSLGGRQQEAKSCFEKSLDIRPDNIVCRAMMKKLSK